MKSEDDNDNEIFQICLDLHHFTQIKKTIFWGRTILPTVIQIKGNTYIVNGHQLLYDAHTLPEQYMATTAILLYYYHTGGLD